MMNLCVAHSDINVYAVELERLLSKQEQEIFTRIPDKYRSLQIKKIKNQKKRDMKLLSRIFLMCCIKKEYGIDLKDQKFLYSDTGKPILENHPHIHFNISHSGNLIVCVFAPTPIGVDVELIRDFKDGLIERVCSDEEIQTINKSKNKRLEFFKIWTKKEAYLKYLGTGIQSFNLKSIKYPDNVAIDTSEYKNYVISVAHKI